MIKWIWPHPGVETISERLNSIDRRQLDRCVTMYKYLHISSRKMTSSTANWEKNKISGQQEKKNYTNTKYRVYFKQDLQLHKAWQEATWQCNNCTFYTAHFDFTTAQIVINCTLKYALTKILDKIH